MQALPRCVSPGARIRCHHAHGVCEGRVRGAGHGWIELAGAASDERRFVQVALLTEIVLLESAVEPAAEDDGPARPAPVPMGGDVAAHAQAWHDDEIRGVANAFLDGASDSDIARGSGRTRHQITILRHAFDAARGERNPDDCSPAARAWIDRLRRVLRPA